MYEFKNDYSFTKDEVVELFKSVDWHSANYPDKLYKALLNYPTVITAYKDNKLVGLAATMDDGIMNAYIHYVCVNPSVQGEGVGKRLMEMTNEVYKDYVNVVLISYNNTLKFYEACNYSFTSDSCAMKLRN